MKRTIIISPTYQNCPIGGLNINVGDVKINLCHRYHSKLDRTEEQGIQLILTPSYINMKSIIYSPIGKEWQHYYAKFFPFSSMDESYIYILIRTPLAGVSQNSRDVKESKNVKEIKQEESKLNPLESKPNSLESKPNSLESEPNSSESNVAVYKCPPIVDIKINNVEFKNNTMTITGTGIIDQINRPETSSIVTYIKHPVIEQSSEKSPSNEKHYIYEPKPGVDLLPIYPTSWAPLEGEDMAHIKRLENGIDQIMFVCNHDPQFCKNIFINVQSVQLELTLYSNGEYHICASNLFKITK